MTEKIKDASPKAVHNSKKKEIHYHYHQGPGTSGTQTLTEKRDGDEVTSVHHHYYYEPPRIEKERSSKPKIVGALLYIVGIIGVIFAIVLILAAAVFGGIEGMIEDFSGMENGEIWGEVTFEDGSPAKNVTVSIINEDISTTTGADGKYLLRDVPIGNQKMRVELEGYKTIEKKIFVNAERKSDFVNKSGSNVNIPDGTTNPENDHYFVLEPGSGVVEEGQNIPFGMLTSLLYICGAVSLIMSIITIISGYFAQQRKNFWFVALGAVCGIFSIGFFISSIMAFVALFILILSRKEFS